MAQYKLNNRAVEDLSKIWNYTFEVWSKKQADKYHHALISHERANNPSIPTCSENESRPNPETTSSFKIKKVIAKTSFVLTIRKEPNHLWLNAIYILKRNRKSPKILEKYDKPFTPTSPRYE